MKKPLLIRGARQLLTLHGPCGPRRGAALRDLGIIQDGALLVRDGRISCAGASRRVENLAEARNAVEIDATGKVVAPGFVDSHTHLVCGPPRLRDYEMRLAGATYHEIAEAGGGILSTVRAVRSSSPRRLELDARGVLRLFAASGTTTVEAKSGYGLDDAAELKTLRLLKRLNGDPVDIVPTYLGAHTVPAEYAGRAGDYIDWVCSEMLPLVASRRLAVFADVYCEQGAFSVPQARRYLSAAQGAGLRIKVHAEQFSRCGGAALGVSLGAASVDHLEYAGSEEALALATSDTVAALLPGAVFHLGLERYAPARMLIDSGAAVALATDFNPGTSPTCSMPMVMSLACARMRMTPAEAFAAATINGAWALGRADRCGSLEAGKDADIVIYQCGDFREIPYHFGVNLAAAVIKRGEKI